MYSDAEDNAESLAFASKYDRKTVAIRMQSRYLGVKALARDDATALFRAKPLSIPYLKTVAWAVKRQEDCVKLKALGGEDGLYLHMSKKGVPVLAPNMSGDKGQFQLWRINNVRLHVPRGACARKFLESFWELEFPNFFLKNFRKNFQKVVAHHSP